jgi:hypothetical protein
MLALCIPAQMPPSKVRSSVYLSKSLCWLGLLLLALSPSGHLWAQADAQISGSVTDKSGAAVADAQVVILNTATGAERRVSSSADGTFVVPLLSPGTYKVTIQKQGFRQAIRDNLILEVDQSARVDAQMEVGNVSESIEVTSAAPLIDTESSSVGQVIERKAIEDLPLNGRNFVQLATLGPGVSGVGFGSRGTIMSGTRPDDLRPGSEIFANGNREGSNNFLIDGADNNERLTLSITLRPSVEAVREFKIQTNMFAADQGRNGGATVNVVTKSGSNEWHGSAYNFLRNDALDARNYFAPVNRNKPAFRQNQFGASLGGKIIPNKLFFFTNYEGFRRSQERVFVNTVPTTAMRVGDFSAVRDIFDPATLLPSPTATSRFVRSPFPGRLIPANRFDSVMGRLVRAYPQPQTTGLVNNHISTPKERQQWNQGDGRIDLNKSEKDTIFGRYSRQDTATTRPSTFEPVTIAGLSSPVSLGNEDTFAGTSDLKAHQAVLTWVRTISPSLIMEARAGFNRFNLNFLQEGAEPGARLGEALGVRNSNQGPQSDGIPIFSPAGYTGIGQTRSLPIKRIETTYNPAVNFTNLRGRHTLKFGFDTRVRRLTQFQTNRGNGRFNFARTFTDDPNNPGPTGDAMAALLLGTANVIEQDFTLAIPMIRANEYGYYLQDDWKVNSRLTINAGLRYEYDTPTSEKYNRWTNFDVITGKLLIAGLNTDRWTGVRPDRNNFSPRLGFAYNVRTGTVIRGGAGIFYNTAGSEGALLRRHRQLPFGPINVVDINQFVPNPRRVQDGLNPIPNLDPNFVANNPSGALIAIAPDFESGSAYQLNFQVQQQLPKQLVAKVGYVSTLGRQLDTTYDYNQPVPGPGALAPRRPLVGIAPNVISATYNITDGRSNYHSLQSTLERRFANGIGFVTAYTWAHSIDNVANAFGGADNGPIPQDRRFRNADRGTSGFDIKHRLTHAMNFALPVGKGRKWEPGNRVFNYLIGGWDANTIITAQSGLPFTPILGTSVSNAGGSRPDALRSAKLDQPTRVRWFDTSFNSGGNNPTAAWGQPQLFTFGNGGRNILRGPGRFQLDSSFFKDLSPVERFKVQFRAEFFNLLNTPQFDLPNPTIGTPNAGIITSTVGANRQVQLALRFAF